MTCPEPPLSPPADDREPVRTETMHLHVDCDDCGTFLGTCKVEVSEYDEELSPRALRLIRSGAVEDYHGGVTRVAGEATWLSGGPVCEGDDCGATIDAAVIEKMATEEAA